MDNIVVEMCLGMCANLKLAIIWNPSMEKTTERSRLGSVD